MTATEIILIIIGFIAVIVGYIMPAHIGSSKEELNAEKAKKHVESVVRHSLDDAKTAIKGQIEDSMEETLVKSERGMERITNDKISAISEYAGTVLEDIHKNHDEVVFMYDMLNDKHKNLTTLVSDVSKSAADARQTVLDAELTARESMDTANEAMEQIRMARAELEALLNSARTTLGAEPGASAAEAIAHAEASLPGMMRIEDTRFAPLVREFPKVPASDDMHRVLASEPATAEEEEAVKTGDMVAEMLATKKVVPISNGSRDVRIRLDKDLTQAPVSGSALAYAEEALFQAAPPIQDRQDLILQMHNLGKSNVAIARELGVGVGEVRLVIDLFSNKRKVRKA